ncbi:hypothetical protein Taro_013043 [Colocasia esculenta]|uniref:Uncharacterized protein n=1 Tax=Colocasia esculenta TaxID=4460 RepID=A0A843UAZ2_COLES|nr:hypothetical protein [Colocasia esculenta]
MDEKRLLGKFVQYMGRRDSTTMKVNRAANPAANMHTSGSVNFATHQSRLVLIYVMFLCEIVKGAQTASDIQEVFDKTHKKKGTDQYTSDRAREVAESYNQ